MRARFNLFTSQCLGDNWRIGWLNGDRDKIGLAFGAFNVAADASQRTASPNASNKFPVITTLQTSTSKSKVTKILNAFILIFQYYILT